MTKINLEDLAEVFKKGFEGSLEFSGEVLCGNKSHPVYSGKGVFGLSAQSINERIYVLDLSSEHGIQDFESSFYFSLSRRAKIKIDAPNNIISFLVVFPRKSRMIIKANSKIYGAD